LAVVETEHVGDGTRVGAFAHILPGAVIGRDCNICDQTFLENDVRVGDRVTIKCGVQLWNGVVLEDEVFVGPNATFTNDSFPRSASRLLVPEGRKAEFMNHISALGVPIRRTLSNGYDGPTGYERGSPSRGWRLRSGPEFCLREVSLPIHPYLCDDEISRVIDACNKWAR